MRQAKKGIKRDHSTTFRPDIRGGLPAGGDRGFIPVAPLLSEATLSSVFIGGFFYTGFVLSLFAVNWLHNTTHAVIGIAELNVY